MIHRVIELRDQIDPAIGVRGEVLDVVAKNLIIADNRKDVIERVDRRHEQTDFFDRAGHAPGSDEITGIVAFTSLADAYNAEAYLAARKPELIQGCAAFGRRSAPDWPQVV
jgi:hypothetical protein